MWRSVAEQSVGGDRSSVGWTGRGGEQRDRGVGGVYMELYLCFTVGYIIWGNTSLLVWGNTSILGVVIPDVDVVLVLV